MFKKKNIVAIIPARGNSRRIINKNLKKINNKNLIEITIQEAKKSRYLDDICITSDSSKIRAFSKKFRNVKIVKRPSKFSNSVIMPDSAVLHAYNFLNKKYDYIVMLQPTSPFRLSKDIDLSIKKIINKNADSLLSVYRAHSFLWKKKKTFFDPINYKINKRPRSQEHYQFAENGAIYIAKSKMFIKTKNRLGGKIIVYEMESLRSLDINTAEDLKLANFISKTFLK
jgi:CMP-N-acetylneuraminic acid synthetase